jgi:sulfite reductase beta subunit-like hemoprotein
MSSTTETHAPGSARLHYANEAEIDEFAQTLARYERGEIGPDEWRTFRLARGTYGQRQPGDVSMLRVKIPMGVLDGPQLHALADVAERYSRGFGHLTTRQNVQFHFMKLHDVEPAMRRLAEAGVTSREACGSAVRNITACPYAGVAGDEVFDVTPYAETLARHLLRHPLGSGLPRKFKMAFEGCPVDHASTAINDIGWTARVRDRRRGFRVTVAGGTSIMARSGQELYAFLPAGEILSVTEAVLRVFQRLGDYKHKQRNRMKFLVQALGFEKWREELEAALAEVKATGPLPLPFDPEAPPGQPVPARHRRPAPSVGAVAERAAAALIRGPGFTPPSVPALPVQNGDYGRWVRTNAGPQRQEGYALVAVTVPLGDLTGAQMRILGDLAEAYGDGTIHTSHDQGVHFRWVPHADVPALYARLSAAGLGRAGAGTLSDVTSCPGAEACRLAVTQSRGLGRLLGDTLAARPDLADAAPGLNIKISGCPNGCGQHHIAGLGFQGSVRQVGGKALPQYFVMVGGGSTAEGAAFGRIAAKVPARRIPEVVERIVGLYTAEGSAGEAADAFLRRVELPKLKALLADLEQISEGDMVKSDFIDLGDEAEFKVEAMEGECSA